MINLHNVLVATDFSEPSDAALRHGRALAQAFDASLHVLHVVEDAIAHAWMPEVYIAALPDVYDEIEKTAGERLDNLFDAETRQALRLQVALRRGTPFVEIIDYARSQDIDLIVVGTHGRGAIAHLMIGSVAEKVVRKAPCPVLTVRHPEHEFVMP